MLNPKMDPGPIRASRRRRGPWDRLRVRTRWGWRRLRNRAPAWGRRAGPWLSSLAAHGVILLILALIVRFVQDDPSGRPHAIDGQLRDDVTSLHPADRAGDPFTKLDSLEPPSLPADPHQIDPDVTNVPSRTPDFRIADALRITPGESPSNPGMVGDAAGAGEGPAAGDGPPGPTAPMLGRRGEMRAKLVRREGGTVQSEAAVELGLDWIARHQRMDGGWSLDTSIACEAPGCPPRMSMQSDAAATGLALLPLLGAGHTHVEKGRYQGTISRGLQSLLRSQQPDGSIYTGGSYNAAMYSHAIATMALCESYALTRDKRLRRPAERAVRFIARSQHGQGGWRYQPMAEGDTSVFGWMIFALRSADIGGIPVPRRTIRQAGQYLNRVATDKTGATYAYKVGHKPTMTMTAEALVCRQILGWPREQPGMLQGVSIISQDLDQSVERNIYYWYYATQLLHNMKDKNWERWNERVRDGLVSMQVKGSGCDHGSWDPMLPQEDLWGAKAGRLYTTSLSLLTLEVYYRYLPLYRDQGGELVGSDAQLADLDEGAEPKPEQPKAKAAEPKPKATKPEDADR